MEASLQHRSACLCSGCISCPWLLSNSILVMALLPCLNGRFYPPRNCAWGCSCCGVSSRGELGQCVSLARMLAGCVTRQWVLLLSETL